MRARLARACAAAVAASATAALEGSRRAPVLSILLPVCILLRVLKAQLMADLEGLPDRPHDSHSLALLLGFKDVTPEDIAGTVSSDIAEDLQVLGIMRDVEDPVDRVLHHQHLALIPRPLLFLLLLLQNHFHSIH